MGLYILMMWKRQENLEKHLRNALKNNEFLLYYQPQFDLEKDKISGFEALIRWDNTELGFVSPDRFIGIAEETHLIIAIGEWVLKTACVFIKQLHEKGYSKLTMSVGVEHQHQLDYLKKHSCQKIQGYLISRPLTSEKAIEFIKKF